MHENNLAMACERFVIGSDEALVRSVVRRTQLEGSVRRPPSWSSDAYTADVKERWFADDRDLVKWSALLHFARAHALTRIIQVAYARTDERPQVAIGEHTVAVDDVVWTFFRDLQRIQHLGATTGIPIDVINDIFDPKKRIAYQQRVIDVLAANRDGAVLLFLDPDTGLQPTRASPQHVTREEVQAFWRQLAAGDWLALYQHARHDRSWADDVQHEFSALCGGVPIDLARSTEIGKDVALLFARKA